MECGICYEHNAPMGLEPLAHRASRRLANRPHWPEAYGVPTSFFVINSLR